MKISEIQPSQGSIHIVADVIDMTEPREFQKYGKTLRVVSAIIKDESGTCKLTLWNDEIGKVKKGDKVEVTNGYARQYQDEIQLTAGKFGKVEVIGKAESVPEDSKEEKGSSEDLFKDEEEW